MSTKFKKEFTEMIVAIDDIKIAHEFLSNILTPKELNEMALRLQVLKQVKAGVPHRKIATDLDVSISTVSRGSREVKYSKSKFINSLS